MAGNGGVHGELETDYSAKTVGCALQSHTTARAQAKGGGGGLLRYKLPHPPLDLMFFLLSNHTVKTIRTGILQWKRLGGGRCVMEHRRGSGDWLCH